MACPVGFFSNKCDPNPIDVSFIMKQASKTDKRIIVLLRVGPCSRWDSIFQ